MNSVSGLKLMKHNNFKKHAGYLIFILTDGTRHAECSGKGREMSSMRPVYGQGNPHCNHLQT